MSYRIALENMRRQMQEPVEPVETPQAPRPRGLASPKRSPTPTPKTEYEPLNFTRNALRSIEEARRQFERDMDHMEADAEAERPPSVMETLTESIRSSDGPAVEEGSTRGLFSLGESPEITEEGVEVTTSPRNTTAPVRRGNPAPIIENSEFLNRVGELAQKYNTSPENLMALMHFETGGSFDPAQRNNAGGSALGLIQFMPSTMEELGVTREEVAAMSAVEQLDLVDSYFERWGMHERDNNTLENLYMTVLWPSARNRENNHVLFSQGSREYAANSGLDRDNKGYVTVNDAASAVRRFVPAYEGVFRG